MKRLVHEEKKMKYALLALLLVSFGSIAEPKLENTKQVVQISEDTHNWHVDLDCKKELDPKQEAIVRAKGRDVRVGAMVRVEQDGKKQRCEVRQLLVTFAAL